MAVHFLVNDGCILQVFERQAPESYGRLWLIFYGLQGVKPHF